MTILQLRELFSEYVRSTNPIDMYDAAGGAMLFDESGKAQWSFADTLWRDGRQAVLTVRRYHIVAEADQVCVEKWAQEFAKFAGLKLRGSTTRILRDKGADYDIEVEARLELYMTAPSDEPSDAATAKADKLMTLVRAAAGYLAEAQGALDEVHKILDGGGDE